MFKLVITVLITLLLRNCFPQFKEIVVVALAVASVSAAPGAVLAAYTAPAVVTAQSSQVIARNYNTLAAPLVAAPVAVAAPLKAAPFVAAPYAVAAPLKAAPFVASPYAVTAPLKAAPLVASPLGAHVVSPFAAPLAAAPYYAPHAYAAAPSYFL